MAKDTQLLDVLIPGRVELKARAGIGTKVRYKTMVGRVRGFRDCRLHGCGGVRFVVRWADGHVTVPCSRGMRELGDGSWRIPA